MTDARQDKLLALLFDEHLLQLKEHDRMFNPLRVLGVQRYELRHVRTLAWLLDPDGSHDLGDAFLMRFMTVVATKAEQRSVLARMAMVPDGGVRIRREVSQSSLESLHDSEVDEALSGKQTPADTADATGVKPIEGALDLLVESADNSWVLAIEAKVGTTLHSNQLKRYRKSLEIGAKTATRMLVLLTTDPDTPPPDDIGWIHVTWQEAVIPALQVILDGPYGRQPRPASQFIASYVEVLEDLCAGSEGKREQLLSAIIEAHDSVLNDVIGRVAGNLPEEIRNLVEANAELFGELARRYQAPNQRRRKALEGFVRSQPEVTYVASQLSSVRFVPNAWLQYDWVTEGRHEFPSVVCEILNNRDHGYRFKLMITDLGDKHKDSKHFAKRTAFYKALQEHPRRRKLFGATLKANGSPKAPEPDFPAAVRTAYQSDPSANSIDRIREFYESTFKASIEAATEVMATIG